MVVQNSTAWNEIFYSDSPVSSIHKFRAQIYPSKIRIEPNDKDTKVAFKLSETGTDRLLNGETFRVIEKRDHKKHGDVKTAYQILNSEGYEVRRPLNQLDRAVHSVCFSEMEAGNCCTTPAVIFRALTGKVGRCDAEPSTKQREAIFDSLGILMGRLISLDTTELCEQLKYNSGKPIIVKSGMSAILPAWYIDAEINGKDAATIFFEHEGPLMTIAKAKKQLITYDACLLDVPNQQNTPMNIAVKNYIILRVHEIKIHKLTPTITFADVFAKCRIADASNDTKMNARNAIVKLFEHLQNQSVIKSFQLTKQRNFFYGVSFTY